MWALTGRAKTLLLPAAEESAGTTRGIATRYGVDVNSSGPAAARISILGVAFVLVAGAGLSSADRAQRSATTVSGSGVGKVRIGRSYDKLRDAGLVGKLKSGCELAEGTRAAKLKSPLKGVVNFSIEGKPRAETISVTDGASTKKGIEVGSTKREVKDAYKSATFDKDTIDVFGVINVKIPKRSGGKFHIAIDAGTKLVTMFGIPGIPFCE